jgi:hypothetical protein
MQLLSKIAYLLHLGLIMEMGFACYFKMKTINISRTCGYDLECQHPTASGFGDGMFASINNEVTSPKPIGLDALTLCRCAPPLNARKLNDLTAYQHGAIFVEGPRNVGTADFRRTNITDGFILG